MLLGEGAPVPTPTPKPMQAEQRAAWRFRGRPTPDSTHSVCRPRRRSSCPRFAFVRRAPGSARAHDREASGPHSAAVDPRAGTAARGAVPAHPTQTKVAERAGGEGSRVSGAPLRPRAPLLQGEHETLTRALTRALTLTLILKLARTQAADSRPNPSFDPDTKPGPNPEPKPPPLPPPLYTNPRLSPTPLTWPR